MLKKPYVAFLIFYTSAFYAAPSSAEDRLEIKADLAADETWRVFPTFATKNQTGQTTAKLRVWVYEEERRSTLRGTAVAALKGLFGLSDLVINEDIFATRARYFLVDNERNKTISVFLRQKELGNGTTDETGQVQINLTWITETPSQLQRPIWINTQLTPQIASEADDAKIIQLIPEKGTSIISDIDDTIKLTGVLNKQELLERTFGKPFEDVQDMAKMYRKFEEEKAATFHYVSSSPWQLLPELQKFLTEKKFPPGSFHLKSFRLKDSRALALFEDPIAYKTAIIEELLKGLPGRDFYLIGDSGEKDPEIYADIARRFPQRITGIMIRLVPTHNASDTRFSQTFAGIKRTKWQLFTSVNEIKL